jgi:hypothetical protein
MSTIIELATGSTTTTKFGSGVNQALAVEAQSVFEVKESVAGLRKFAARIESTSEASLEMEKFNAMTITSGGDLEDGTDATFTVIDNQALVTFNSPTALSVGFKLTPKLLRQARSDPNAFMERYRRKIAFDLARKEDTYIGSILTLGTNKVYGGAGTSTSTVGVGSILTVELLEKCIDDMKTREYEPTDYIVTAKAAGQLRRDARLLNDNGFSLAIKEDGSAVTQFGNIRVHEVKGSVILPDWTSGQGAGSGTTGILIDREGAFGIVDFLKAEGASPVTISVGLPDPTLSGANFHRILGQSEIQAQILDQNAIIVTLVNKQ